MKRIIALATIALFLSACDSKLYPIRSGYNYPPTIMQIPTEKRDELWAKIMKLFSDNKIPIATIDRNAGYVKSENLNLRPYARGERIKGESDDDCLNCFVVSDRLGVDSETFPRLPTYIVGAIEILAYDSSNVVNVKINFTLLKASDSYTTRYSYHIKSLNNLETKIAAYFQSKDVEPIYPFKVMPE